MHVKPLEGPLKSLLIVDLVSDRGIFGRFSPDWVSSVPGMEHGIAVEVVGEVGKGGFEATSSLADASEAVAAKLSDAPEGMFDTGADPALFLVGAFLFAAERTGAGTFFADVGEHGEAFEQRRDERPDVGAVGPQDRLAVAFA